MGGVETSLSVGDFLLSNFFMVTDLGRGFTGVHLASFWHWDRWAELSPGPSYELAWPQTEDHSNWGEG